MHACIRASCSSTHLPAPPCFCAQLREPTGRLTEHDDGTGAFNGIEVCVNAILPSQRDRCVPCVLCALPALPHAHSPVHALLNVCATISCASMHAYVHAYVHAYACTLYYLARRKHVTQFPCVGTPPPPEPKPHVGIQGTGSKKNNKAPSREELEAAEREAAALAEREKKVGMCMYACAQHVHAHIHARSLPPPSVSARRRRTSLRSHH